MYASAAEQSNGTRTKPTSSVPSSSHDADRSCFPQVKFDTRILRSNLGKQLLKHSIGSRANKTDVQDAPPVPQRAPSPASAKA
jgi:hypothetical protein